MKSVAGRGNAFPEGQCTWYADNRYHALTGYYVPFSGNAKDWASNAVAYGWSVSSTPVIPSIICLQGGVQGADATYGHVGVVEGISGTSVVTSDLNWQPTPNQITSVTFNPGPGVSFIYANAANGRALGGGTTTLADTIGNIFSGGGGGAPIIALKPNADVTDLLVTLDSVLVLVNPFDMSVPSGDINIAGASISFSDPVAFVEQLGYNLATDTVAIVLRVLFIAIGAAILIKVLSNFIDFGTIAQTATSGASAIQALGLLAA